MGIEHNAAGDYPKVATSACVHPSAVLIGNVEVHDMVFVGPQAVIRADEPDANGNVAPITICEGSNIQDCVVIHALGGTSVTVRSGTSIAHSAIIHGPCEIGSNSFVGFNSVVFNASLDDGVIVMHQALVQDVQVPAGLYIPSSTSVCCETDVELLTHAAPDMVAFARKVCRTNVTLVEATLKNRRKTK